MLQRHLHRMISMAYLWIPFVILASLGQVARNAMQRELTASLGTVGATHVRFLFGFPFSIVFFAVVMLVTRESVTWPSLAFWLWLVVGTMTQIVATGLDAGGDERALLRRHHRLHQDRADPGGAVRLHLSGRPSDASGRCWRSWWRPRASSSLPFAPAATRASPICGRRCSGVAAAAAFALSAVGYRGAILNVPGVSFVTAASFTLVLGLMLQTLVLTTYLLLRDRETLARVVPDVEAVDAGGLPGRGCVAVLVSRLRHHQRRQRPHAGADRGAVRAGDRVLLAEAEDFDARGARHRADRRSAWPR